MLESNCFRTSAWASKLACPGPFRPLGHICVTDQVLGHALPVRTKFSAHLPPLGAAHVGSPLLSAEVLPAPGLQRQRLAAATATCGVRGASWQLWQRDLGGVSAARSWTPAFGGGSFEADTAAFGARSVSGLANPLEGAQPVPLLPCLGYPCGLFLECFGLNPGLPQANSFGCCHVSAPSSC